ncbi:18386_t:CDS:2 [Funneliformis geosporum]|uniref:18386_t:CDS:1 n=1 Tax=Funneliformis geosporum TaxID=1117311 RepID=A0A9W4WVL9_9GLOM|nr:18386_t:CDS:2 [Funneliformis geosporum]
MKIFNIDNVRGVDFCIFDLSEDLDEIRHNRSHNFTSSHYAVINNADLIILPEEKEKKKL